MRIENFIRRFHKSYTVDENGCWIWQKSKNPQGYAAVKLKLGDLTIQLGHRISYYLFKGDILKGMLVRHTCDTPSCVNPDHLLLGTYADNSADAIERGGNLRMGKSGVTETYRRGKTDRNDKWQAADKNWQAKLDWPTVRAIRADTGLTLHQLSDKYGISVSQCHRIRNYLSWVE